MSLPRVVAVEPGSPAARAGLVPGDELVAMNGRSPRDVIQYRMLADEADLELDVRRGGVEMTVAIAKEAGGPLGLEVHSALFDQVRTCDNHCEFCFIYQLPKGLRPSLYVKDDDYRLSFLYGNFTTLTRFTEADLERVVTERLSPLFVSIHATDPDVRTRMLRNRRGATSLRWLRALLDHGIEVHGQIVVCPGVNDGPVLETTLAGILDEYPELASAAAVPLGVSRFNAGPAMRPHTAEEAAAVVDTIEAWQDIFFSTLGRRLVHAADEYYLVSGRPLPPADAYEGFPQHENGIGMIRAFEAAAIGAEESALGTRAGFFAWVDGAPAEGYRAVRHLPVTAAPSAPSEAPAAGAAPAARAEPAAPVAVLTGAYGARVLPGVLASLGRTDVRVVPVENRFFGGNVGVAGLLVGEDLARVLAAEPPGWRYLLPDVCLSAGVFLDGTRPEDLPRPVEVVATDGRSLRTALGGDALAGTGARR